MSEAETLLEFPCRFPIKVMGRVDVEFDLLVVEIIGKHVEVNATDVVTRPSKAGNYLAVTVTIEALSKQQLDAIYIELSQHPHVLMAL